MDSPSWTDVVQASFSSCLHCLSFRAHHEDEHDEHDDNQGQRHRRAQRPPALQAPQHLQSLLADASPSSSSLSSEEAETLSLHSDVGQQRKKKNKGKRRKKTITFFGFDLFGRQPRHGPIHLPDDDEDDEAPFAGSRSRRRENASTSSSSGYTFDSDAAPLSTAVINTFGEEDVQARLREERERFEKEERKRKKRDRKEMKKLAEVLKQHHSEGGAAGADAGHWHGWPTGGDPSSADAYPAFPSPQHAPMMTPPLPYQPQQQYTGPPVDLGQENDDDDDADLDGVVYARRNTAHTSSDGSGGAGSSSRRSHSDTRSNGSGSAASNTYISANDQLVPPASSLKKEKKSKKSKSKSKSSTQSQQSSSSAATTATTATTSSSTSIQSPTSPLSASFIPTDLHTPNDSNVTIKPTIRDTEFEGVSFDGVQVAHGDFPSTGLGILRAGGVGAGRRNVNGAFLATIGTEDA